MQTLPLPCKVFPFLSFLEFNWTNISLAETLLVDLLWFVQGAEVVNTTDLTRLRPVRTPPSFTITRGRNLLSRTPHHCWARRRKRGRRRRRTLLIILRIKLSAGWSTKKYKISPSLWNKLLQSIPMEKKNSCEQIRSNNQSSREISRGFHFK